VCLPPIDLLQYKKPSSPPFFAGRTRPPLFLDLFFAPFFDYVCFRPPLFFPFPLADFFSVSLLIFHTPRNSPPPLSHDCFPVPPLTFRIFMFSHPTILSPRSPVGPPSLPLLTRYLGSPSNTANSCGYALTQANFPHTPILAGDSVTFQEAD